VDSSLTNYEDRIGPVCWKQLLVDLPPKGIPHVKLELPVLQLQG